MTADEVRGLARAARSSYSTLCATVRDWSSYRRICEVQGRGWSRESDETGERSTRVWLSADGQVREELDTGEVRRSDQLDEASNWPLFDPGFLADENDIVVIGDRQVAGRPGIAIETPNPAGLDLLPGADRCVYVLDRERGVALRCEAWLGDELLMIEEMVDVAFDEPVDAGLFDSG